MKREIGRIYIKAIQNFRIRWKRQASLEDDWVEPTISPEWKRENDTFLEDVDVDFT